MRRASGALLPLQQAVRSGPISAQDATRGVATFVFSSLQDAPTASLSKSVNLTVKSGKTVDVDCSVGKASVKAKYAPADLRKLQATTTTLYDTARISVLHSSILEFLCKSVHERYSILADWPDFSTMYGKDYFYRAHPEDVKKFYGLADEFHRMWDTITEFDSLSNLALDLVPGYRQRRLNLIHPLVGPTTSSGAVSAFLVGHAK